MQAAPVAQSALPAFNRLTISPPPLPVRSTMAAGFAALNSSVTGTPPRSTGRRRPALAMGDGHSTLIS